MWNPVKFLRAKSVSPRYTRRQWSMKAVSAFIAFIGMDLAGSRVGYYDNQVQLMLMTPAEAYGAYYAYSCAVTGLFMGFALWRILELYWWAKDVVEGKIT